MIATGSRSVARSNNTHIDGLLWGMAWNGDTITYDYPTSALLYFTPYGDPSIKPDPATFVAFDDRQKLAVDKALLFFTSVCNLTFVLKTNESKSDQATIRFGFSSENDPTFANHAPGMIVTGLSYSPGSQDIAGDSWYPSSIKNWD